MIIKFKGKKLDIGKIKKSFGIIGLMFSRRQNASALVFDSRGALHSFFVSYDFLVLWVNNQNEVVDFKIVHPNSAKVQSKKDFSKIIEVPINDKYKFIVDFIVGKGKYNDEERFKKKRVL